jgi:[protein-PII] uridylyltransferase
MANVDALDQFVASMPVRYVQTFGIVEIQQHARIVRERGQQLAHVGQFASMRHHGAALCVVAQDRPGLLATISSALTLSDLSVIEAEIFTRRVSPSLNEAVDLFWIIRKAPLQHVEITPGDVSRVRHYLADLLSHSTSVPPERTSAFMNRASETSTRVRFIDDAQGCFTTLEVDANDRSGLLLAICRTLFAANVQIVGSHIKAESGRARGRFELVELDERPIAAGRRHDMQLAILSAIDQLNPTPMVAAAG